MSMETTATDRTAPALVEVRNLHPGDVIDLDGTQSVVVDARPHHIAGWRLLHLSNPLPLGVCHPEDHNVVACGGHAIVNHVGFDFATLAAARSTGDSLLAG